MFSVIVSPGFLCSSYGLGLTSDYNEYHETEFTITGVHCKGNILTKTLKIVPYSWKFVIMGSAMNSLL